MDSAGVLIHMPGYFSLNHMRMATMGDFFGQLWKEYALSDSRYLTSDPFVLTMETTTAVCIGCTLAAVEQYVMLTRTHSLLGDLSVLLSLGLSLLKTLYDILYLPSYASGKCMVTYCIMLRACSTFITTALHTVDLRDTTSGVTTFL